MIVKKPSMEKQIQNKHYFKYKDYIILLILILLSFIPLFDLFQPGLPITHDGQDHVARIANFYQNLSEGNIVPRWAANLNWGYGHPILMFLYPLPSYIASLFHFIGFSLIDSTKLVFGITYIFSGITMYLWINEFLGKRSAFISSLLYLFAPYRFVDLYVRGAIGEHVAFVFPPLILYFLLKRSKQHSYWYIVGGSLSLAGLILSHNAISLMFLPLIFLYAIYLIWQSKDKKLYAIRYTLIAILGFGLSAFFWMPAFFEGKYTLRDIVTAGEYSSRFVDFGNLIFGQWSYGGSGQFSVQIGFVQWIVVIFSIPTMILLKSKKNRLWTLSLSIFLIFAISLFLMTEQAQLIWDRLSILQKFQFPWRLLSITVFTTSILGGLVFFSIPRRAQLAICCLLLVTVLWLNKDYWHANGFLLKEESFYTNIYPGTTDTGESSPIWSVRFMESEPNARLEIIAGKGQFSESIRTSTRHVYEMTIQSSKARIRENTLYFPGWEVLVDGQKTNIEFQDPANRGLITFFASEGKHLVEIAFKETRLRYLADVVSALSVVIMGVYLVFNIKLRPR